MYNVNIKGNLFQVFLHYLIRIYKFLFPADNESDSGYDPSFLTNLRSGGMGGGGGSSAPEDGGQDNEEDPIANSEPG